MKNIMYKLKILTETLETENLSLVDAAHLIDTSIKSLEDINCDTNSMDNLIESASLFAKKLEVDLMSDFKTHHRTRKLQIGWIQIQTTKQNLRCRLFIGKNLKVF